MLLCAGTTINVHVQEDGAVYYLSLYNRYTYTYNVMYSILTGTTNNVLVKLHM